MSDQPPPPTRLVWSEEIDKRVRAGTGSSRRSPPPPASGRRSRRGPGSRRLSSSTTGWRKPRSSTPSTRCGPPASSPSSSIAVFRATRWMPSWLDSHGCWPSRTGATSTRNSAGRSWRAGRARWATGSAASTCRRRRHWSSSTSSGRRGASTTIEAPICSRGCSPSWPTVRGSGDRRRVRARAGPYLEERYQPFDIRTTPYEETLYRNLYLSFEAMRGHLVGPDRTGDMEVVEDDEKVVIAFDPCGSGNRGQRGDPSRARPRVARRRTTSASRPRSTTGRGTRQASATTAPTAATPSSTGRPGSGVIRCASSTHRGIPRRRPGRRRSGAPGRSTSRSTRSRPRPTNGSA